MAGVEVQAPIRSTTKSSNSPHLVPLPNLAPKSGLPARAGAGDSPIGKKKKRATRATKRLPTALLAADPSNFRAMVQQLTGINPNPNPNPNSSSQPGFGILHHAPAPAPAPPPPPPHHHHHHSIATTPSFQNYILPTLDTSSSFLNNNNGNNNKNASKLSHNASKPSRNLPLMKPTTYHHHTSLSLQNSNHNQQTHRLDDSTNYHNYISNILDSYKPSPYLASAISPPIETMYHNNTTTTNSTPSYNYNPSSSSSPSSSTTTPPSLVSPSPTNLSTWDGLDYGRLSHQYSANNIDEFDLDEVTLAESRAAPSSSCAFMQVATMGPNQSQHQSQYVDDSPLFNMMMNFPQEGITNNGSNTNPYASIESWLAHDLFDGSAAAMANMST